jgi:hypothetical protein
MEQSELLQEIRYVRGRIDQLHDRMNTLIETSADDTKKHETEIVRLQEQTHNMRWVAGKISGFVATVISAVIASILSFAIKQWQE